MTVLTPAESDSNYILGVGVNNHPSGRRTFDVNSPSNIIASETNDRQLLPDNSIEKRKLNIISGADEEEEEENATAAPDRGGHLASIATEPYKPYDQAVIDQIVVDDKFDTLK